VGYHLSCTPGLSVVLLEREPVLASHSSGRNAAIFRPRQARPELAARSVQLVEERVRIEGVAAAEHAVDRAPELVGEDGEGLGLAMLGRLTEGEGCAEYADQKG